MISTFKKYPDPFKKYFSPNLELIPDFSSVQVH